MTDACFESWRAPGSNGYPGADAHQRVCLEFHGPKPRPYDEVRHLCGNKLCIWPPHLAWGSRSENAIDTRDHCTQPNQKLTSDQVNNIRTMYANGGWSHAALAAEFGCSKPNITSILNNRTWKV